MRFLSDKVEYTISAAGLFLGKDLGGDRLFWLCNEVGICRFWSCDPFWRPLALWDPFRRRGLPPSQRRPRISSLCAAYFAQWPKNSQNNLMTGPLNFVNWSILWAFGPLCRLERVTRKRERKREEVFFLFRGRRPSKLLRRPYTAFSRHTHTLTLSTVKPFIIFF